MRGFISGFMDILAGGPSEPREFSEGDRVSIRPCQPLGRRVQARVVRRMEELGDVPAFYELETLGGDRLGSYMTAQLRPER